MFHAELATYERLRALQGKKIPTLYGVVEYEIVIRDAFTDGSAATETVPGLLLEYIPSVTLRELIATWMARDPPLPNGILTMLCEEAIQVVDRVSDFDLLNKDVRVDNLLIRQPFVSSSSHGEHAIVVEDAVVLIDFGQCRLRREDESEKEWEEAKWPEDEVGAAGVVIHGLVRKFVGEAVWTYKRRQRYYRPPEWLAPVVLPPGPTPEGSVLTYCKDALVLRWLQEVYASTSPAFEHPILQQVHRHPSPSSAVFARALSLATALFEF